MKAERFHLAPTPVLILFLMALLSCGGNINTLVAYEGPRRPSNEVAAIMAASSSTVISGVDSIVKKKPFSIKERFIEVLPGPHSVEVNYSHHTIAQRKSSRTSVTLRFEAVSGHVYGVKSSGGYKKWQAWIIDTADSSLVTEKIEGTLN